MKSASISSAASGGSVASAWLRGLELTAPIPKTPGRIFSAVIQELAERHGNGPALLSDRESLTYSGLAQRVNQYARWALEQKLAKGDVVALMMTNRPEYFAAWIGIASAGGVVALLNTNLSGPSLTHCIRLLNPKHLIVSTEFKNSLSTALPDCAARPSIWAHGFHHASFQRIEDKLQKQSGDRLDSNEGPRLTIEDRALYIFTSGTTGLPKAASISHARVMQWSHWFAGMMNVQPGDRTYSCLPMYHSIGGVLVPGAALVGGASAVVREKFSAAQFWNDVRRWDCTIFHYIGEFCRYLLHAPDSYAEAEHRIRLACGNGLAPDVWDAFKERFCIPRILEFYASTEGGVSLFNVEGRRGAIGRVPPYLAHRFSPVLVKTDVESCEPIRDENGFCIRCTANEAGEAIGKVSDDPSAIGSRFEGYTDEQASENKILRDVFVRGDAWVRSGDLMRKDERGFYFFVDRIGDTFRWKGENVATSEVAEALCEFADVASANVYGVAVPATEGRAGMAALVASPSIDLRGLRDHLIARLPSYARPKFLRFRDEFELTGTFKYSKVELVQQGYDPTASSDELYFDDPLSGQYVRIDAALFERIQSGHFHL